MGSPGAGGPLLDCTFAEVAQAVPVARRFLTELAKQGAPGAKVSEVFKTEDALQAFWQQTMGP